MVQTLVAGQQRVVSLASLTALAERTIPTEGDAGVRQRITEFLTSNIARYLQHLNQLEDDLRGAGLVDLQLRARFANATNDVIAQGERVVAGLEKETTKRVKAAFREAIHPWTEGNPFIERCLTKPRGYAGDFAMMDGGYTNAPQTVGGLAGAFDRYFLDCYECVRQRKDNLRKHVRHYLLNGSREGRTLRMLALGSGPCREWADLDQERRAGALKDKRVAKAHLTCIDLDPDALAYGRHRLADNCLLESVEYVETNLFGFTRDERWKSQEQSYDLIYGLGIANYFHDAMLESIIASAFTLVRPGGELMITHKDSQTFNFPVADWLCDWVFIKRSAEEYSALFQNALSAFQGAFEWRLEWEPCGEIMFGIAKRTP